MTQALGAGRRDRANKHRRAVVRRQHLDGRHWGLAALVAAKAAAAAADQCARLSPALAIPLLQASAGADQRLERQRHGVLRSHLRSRGRCSWWW